MDLFHQKLKVSCAAQISKRSAEMGWGGNIFTDTLKTLFKTLGGTGDGVAYGIPRGVTVKSLIPVHG